jgi:group I intron endonuclease
MGFIYKITNLITNKCYIGETTKADPEKRWMQHKNTIKRGVGCPVLQSSVIKHGIHNFKFEILLICFDEDRYKYEIEYIKKYNALVPNGYNILEGGPGGGFKGKKHSEETRKRMSKNMKQKYIDDPNYGHVHSQETKNLISKNRKGINLGKKVSDETLQKRKNNFINNPEIKQKISNSLKEYHKNNVASCKTRENISNSLKEYHKNKVNDNIGRSPEIKQKISDGLKEYHKNKIVKINLIRINQYDLNNNLIHSFNNIIEACNATSIGRDAISRCCSGKFKFGGGFIWKKE